MKIPRPSRSETFSLILFLLTLITMIVIWAWTNYQLRDLQNAMAEFSYQLPRDGQNGNDGADGITQTIVKEIPAPPAKDGRDGTDAKPINKDEVKAAVDQSVKEYFAVNPVKTEKGDTGEIGRQGLTVFLRLNPITQQTECLFKGDTIWSPLENCQ